jgi:small GTP-binding protein
MIIQFIINQYSFNMGSNQSNTVISDLVAYQDPNDPYKNAPIRKILLLGDEYVGKSCILDRFISDHFYSGYISTLGIDFKCKITKFEGEQTKLQIWDSAGHKRFNTLVTPYTRGSHIIVIVYDRTNMNSFYNIKNWLTMVESNVQDPKIVLVGNKSDLKDQIQVSTEMGRSYALEHGMHYIEASALKNTGIKDIFSGYYDFSRGLEIKEPEGL